MRTKAIAFLILLFSTLAVQPSYSSQVSAPELLQLVSLSPEANSSTYKRDAFKHWVDADGDGCDTRQEVLISESLTKAKMKGACSVSSGRWVSVYDNKPFTNPSLLDIDHFIPLKEAWESGASNWDSEKRMEFANDLDFSGSLIAVSASSNRSKGDRDPSQWAPSDKNYACAYAVTWIQVKYRWGLSVDSAEQKSLSTMLKKCSKTKTYALPDLASPEESPESTPQPTPSQSPSSTSTPTPSATPTLSATPTPSVSITPTPTPSPSSSLDPRFSSCTAAKAAGYGPYVRGVDPEYDWYRDGDNDGVACE